MLKGTLQAVLPLLTRGLFALCILFPATAQAWEGIAVRILDGDTVVVAPYGASHGDFQYAFTALMMASAAWLTFRRERRAFTLSAVNLGTWLARYRASNSRIRRSSIRPPACRPCTVSCISSIMRLGFVTMPP